ncbi:hypothetical protein AVEN_138019-1 [Araneus ventricosus]|uniref:Uncharacterized protein n=1 Tax=Araneus ventricosus TaxID=182803 RepID=A0A4Y2LBC5_ARAVE|nr:hypothetical protein AVEN_246051-1 [Araneus ventricosus]GBN12001.1 hypothetical protein AVEN_138019-1 [Araneus ventricosus]
MAVLGCVQVGQLNVLLPGSNSGANFSWLLVNQCFGGNSMSQVGQLDVLCRAPTPGQISRGSSSISTPTPGLLRPIWRASGARPAMSAGISSHRACYFNSLGLSSSPPHISMTISSFLLIVTLTSAFPPKKLFSKTMS